MDKLLFCMEAGGRIVRLLRANTYFSAAWKQVDEGIGKGYFERLFSEIIGDALNRTRPANAALTLDELQEMDGDPVWWWNGTAKPVCTICIYNKFSARLAFVNFDWQKDEASAITKYEWLKKSGYKPYRYNPRGEGNELK